MALGKEQPDRHGVAELVGKMADGFGRLVTQHVTLAKLELVEDARALGADVARVALFLPFVLLGYALLMGAVVVGVARWAGWGGAFALVGGVNLVGGGAGIARAVVRMRRVRVMSETFDEFKQSAAALSSSAEPSALERTHDE